ncbi:MAG: hypothetical protein RL653_4180 [Pseudomonadota bacterium]
MKTWALALAVCAGQAWADAPCGGVKLNAGAVELGAPPAPASALTAGDTACGKALAAALKGTGGIRSVTVAVRMSDADRSGGGGIAVAKAWAALLASEGIPAARISPVAPLLPAGEKPSVRFAYTEQKSARPVAAVVSSAGEVKTGPDAAGLKPSSTGTKLVPFDHVQTGTGGGARIAIADGSALEIKPDTLLRLGSIELNAQLKRSVRVDLLRGNMNVVASKGGEGSLFEVGTPLGLAGVRGTTFRIGTEGESMRLETLEGAVALKGPGGEVLVGAGQGAVLGADGTPSAPSVLPAVVEGLAPRRGPVGAAGLSWRAVPGAAGYVVEFARDAEFVREPRRERADGTSLPASAVPEGTSWWRVSAQDARGFSGPTSKVYRVTR